MLRKIAKISSLYFATKHFICTNPDHYEYPFVETFQFNANNPIEDRLAYAKLNSINGFAFSVFDGHGGDLVVIFFVITIRPTLHHTIYMDFYKNGLNKT